MQTELVPDELVINREHTSIHNVPKSDWTMAAEGNNRVEILELRDKQQMMTVLG